MENFNGKIADLVQTGALSSGHFIECLEHQSDLGNAIKFFHTKPVRWFSIITAIEIWFNPM